MLLKLLQLKFGELPDSVHAQLEGATEEQLTVWGERVLSAESLDELLQ